MNGVSRKILQNLRDGIDDIFIDENATLNEEKTSIEKSKIVTITYSLKIKNVVDINYLYFIDFCKEIFLLNSNGYRSKKDSIVYCKTLNEKKVTNLTSLDPAKFSELPSWLRDQIRRTILFRFLFSIGKPHLTSIIVDTAYKSFPESEQPVVYSVNENKISDCMEKAITDKLKKFLVTRGSITGIDRQCKEYIRLYMKRRNIADIFVATNEIKCRIEKRALRFCPEVAYIASTIKAELEKRVVLQHKKRVDTE